VCGQGKKREAKSSAGGKKAAGHRLCWEGGNPHEKALKRGENPRANTVDSLLDGGEGRGGSGAIVFFHIHTGRGRKKEEELSHIKPASESAIIILRGGKHRAFIPFGWRKGKEGGEGQPAHIARSDFAWSEGRREERTISHPSKCAKGKKETEGAGHIPELCFGVEGKGKESAPQGSP